MRLALDPGLRRFGFWDCEISKNEVYNNVLAILI